MKVRNKRTGEVFEVPDGTPPDQFYIHQPPVTPSPLTQPAPAPPEATPKQGGIGGFLTDADAFLKGLHEQTGEGIQKVLSGGSPERGLAARTLGPLLNPVPSSVPEAALAVGTAGMGAMPMAGGRIAQVGKRVGLGVLGGAGLYGGEAALKGQEPMGPAIQGAIAGGMGGLMTGIPNAIATPNRATRQSITSIEALKSGGKWSQNVRDAIPDDPKALYSQDTLRKVQRAAGDNIEAMLSDVAEKAGDRLLPLPSAINAPTKQFVTNPLTGQTMPLLNVKEAQQYVAALRKAGKDSIAFQVQRELLNGLGDLAPQYAQAMRQYSHDARLVDVIEGLQKARQAYGVNPVDYPEAGIVSKALGDTKSAGQGASGTAYQGIAAAAHGMTNPTSPFGISHGVGFLQGILGKGPVNPMKVSPISPFRELTGKILAPIAGAEGVLRSPDLKAEE